MHYDTIIERGYTFHIASLELFVPLKEEGRIETYIEPVFPKHPVRTDFQRLVNKALNKKSPTEVRLK